MCLVHRIERIARENGDVIVHPTELGVEGDGDAAGVSFCDDEVGGPKHGRLELTTLSITRLPMPMLAKGKGSVA